MNRAFAVVVVSVACGSVLGCGPGNTGTAPTGGSSSAAVAPPGSTPPSSAAPASADDDFAALTKTALTSEDVGKGWSRQGGVTDTTPSHSKETGKPVDYCPGHVSKSLNDHHSLAGVSQLFTNKTASLYLSSNTMATADSADVKANLVADLKACREFKVAKDHYVVLSPEGPTSLPGADEVLVGFTARHYGDKAHTALGYVGQYLVGRNGRVVTSVTYQFTPSKKDPKGKDFTVAQDLVGRQLKSHAGQFPG